MPCRLCTLEILVGFSFVMLFVFLFVNVEHQLRDCKMDINRDSGNAVRRNHRQFSFISQDFTRNV